MPTLDDLERLYLPSFPTPESKRAVISLLKLVYEQCTINPFDSTLVYPSGQSSLSSLGQLLRFFACGRKVTEMPPDAPTFLAFLKAHKFATNNLCLVKM